MTEPEDEFVARWRERLASNPRFGIDLPASPRGKANALGVEQVAAEYMTARRKVALGNCLTARADQLITKLAEQHDDPERQALFDALEQLLSESGSRPGREGD